MRTVRLEPGIFLFGMNLRRKKNNSTVENARARNIEVGSIKVKYPSQGAKLEGKKLS